NQERDFLYVSDVVRANLLSIEDSPHLSLRPMKIAKKRKFGDFIYNLGTGKGTSVNRIFRILKEITHYKLDPLYAPPKTGEVYKIFLDAEKAKRELGWEPAVYLNEGLKRTVSWFEKAEKI
ncbi:MAG: GDP-mannose 4,6-dehydratase, partial [Candidatus Aerophobetes bacterium]|nr:GDP-mannose 4,6-dehydratase [Candidatus Aerophobetes bacterium]